MKKRRILIALQAAVLTSALASCKTNTDNGDNSSTTQTNKYTSDDMNQKVDNNDDLVSTTYYASPSVEIEYDFDKELNELPQDTPTHKGTKDDPWDIYTALHSIGAGDTLILMEGTYKTPNRFTLSQSGNAKRRIKVRGEGTVILDFTGQEILSSSRGIQLTGDYWDFYNIEITKAGDNGMYIAGSYNKVEYCRFHENQDTGLQLGRATSGDNFINQWPSNNLILNCTSYNNYDVETLGENADGFAAKLTVGEGNVFDGCIAYRNADDGWDMFAKVDSGNIGTITLLNCVAFENGFLLDKTQSMTSITGGTDYLSSYATMNGDGNGFKLGGSSMTGDMILKNCLSFNNRMGGFADNSNPGTLQLFDCTSYNNSVYMSMTDSNQAVDQTGDTGDFGLNDGECKNFAMARTEGSYNTFEGCLSYLTNNTDPNIAYENYDDYKGAASYSIFASGKNKYTQITTPIDSSSYESKKAGTAFTGTLNDSTFKSVELGFTVKGNRNIDSELRNSDGSINMHDFLAINESSELYTFNNGKAIGCTLNKTKSEDYEHVDWVVPTYEGENVSKDLVQVQGAIDVLEVMCHHDYVYQDINLLTMVNGLHVTWYSSNEDILKIGYYINESVSNRSYLIANVKRQEEDQTVTLVATISLNEVSLQKEFKLTIKGCQKQIGKITGYDSKYIVEQYSVFDLPEIVATDANSYSGNNLVLNEDYTKSTVYEYAQSTNDDYYTVDGVYTANSGVYKVTTTITSKVNTSESYQVSYLVYVLSPKANIDVSQDASLASKYGITQTNGYNYQVNATRDGAKVSAAFTNIYGYMYAVTSDAETMTSEEVIENGTRVDINDEYQEVIAPNDNTTGYNVFMVVTNRDGSVVSNVFSQKITTQSISTAQEFNDLVAKESSPTVIYLLENDIDFTNATDLTWNANQVFSGLLNGNGHKISNISIKGGPSDEKTTNIFYKVKNGTIMNISFENISIVTSNAKDQDTGIIGNMCGGYIYNVSLKNIKVNGVTEVGGLVGQLSGGTNYISKVSLVNPMEKGWISASGKYFGGIVGNMQKDTEESKVELYMEDIYVNAYIGNHVDAGYMAGILGRDKNEFESYLLNMNRCYFTGIVDTGYTYSGGVVGSLDSQAGSVTITNCVSDATLIIKDTILNKESTDIGQKNNSPLVGRFTYNEEKCKFSRNYGPYQEYHAEVSSYDDEFATKITLESFWNIIGYTEANGWTFDTETKTMALTNSK